MKEQIVNNFRQHATVIPASTEGMQVYQEAGLSWVDSALKSDTFNVAFVSRSQDVSSPEIEKLQSFYRVRQAAFCLWVPEDQFTPELEHCMTYAGLKRQATAVGMGMHCSDVQLGEVKAIGIERVSTAEQLTAYASVIAANWSPPDLDVQHFYRHATPAYLAPNSPSKLFVFRQQGKVIATGELFAVNEQTAGIYGLCTLEEHRQKGIATMMMSYIMQEACQCGFEYLILHASEAGLGIYQRLGFVTHTNLFEYA